MSVDESDRTPMSTDEGPSVSPEVSTSDDAVTRANDDFGADSVPSDVRGVVPPGVQDRLIADLRRLLAEDGVEPELIDELVELARSEGRRLRALRHMPWDDDDPNPFPTILLFGIRPIFHLHLWAINRPYVWGWADDESIGLMLDWGNHSTDSVWSVGFEKANAPDWLFKLVDWLDRRLR